MNPNAFNGLILDSSIVAIMVCCLLGVLCGFRSNIKLPKIPKRPFLKKIKFDEFQKIDMDTCKIIFRFKDYQSQKQFFANDGHKFLRDHLLDESPAIILPLGMEIVAVIEKSTIKSVFNKIKRSNNV